MKKRILPVLLVLALFVGAAGAKEINPRWTYVSAVMRGIEMVDNNIEWFASADTYDSAKVTHTKVVAKLQVQAGTGWGTLETQTDKQPGTMAGVGGVYSNWFPGKSYRVEVYAYAFNGESTITETVGPLYAYLNT